MKELIFCYLSLILLIVGGVRGSSESPSDSPYTRPCSGQGILYSDSDYQNCECFNCFSGTTCSDSNQNCMVDCSGGNPSLAQQYWEHVELPDSQTLSEAYYRFVLFLLSFKIIKK